MADNKNVKVDPKKVKKEDSKRYFPTYLENLNLKK